MSASQGDNVMNGLLLAVVTFMAAIAVSAALAIANGLFGGPPVYNLTADFFGFEIPGVISGPLRGLAIVSVILALSYVFEFRGVKMSTPFWVGLFMIGLVLAKFIVPGWITGAFTFLNLGEIFLGLPLEEINVGRTVVLGTAFIFVYYLVLVRLKGALGISAGYPGPAKEIDGVLYNVRQGFIRLARDYRKVAVGIAAIFGAVGFFGATGAGQTVASFVAEFGQVIQQSPVWTGYLSSIAIWWVENFTEWLPFGLNAEQMGAAFFILFAMVLVVRYTD